MDGLKKESIEMIISTMGISGTCKKMEAISISNGKRESVKLLLIKVPKYLITLKKQLLNNEQDLCFMTMNFKHEFTFALIYAPFK